MTAFRLYAAWSSANPIFTRLCEGKFNITRREWRLLATLATHGELSSSRLAEVAGLDAARTSRAITALCEKGWVERRRSSADARTVYVNVTEAGRTLYEQIMPAIIELNAQLTQDFNSEELEALHQLLARLGTRAQQLYESGVVSARANRGRKRTVRD